MSGSARAPLLISDVALSFWGGVDPSTGFVVDQHHPLKGSNIAGKILAIPSGRGSSSGSGALLELMNNDLAPAALIFSEPEEILTLGVVVADVMFDRSLPVIQLNKADFQKLDGAEFVQVENQSVTIIPGVTNNTKDVQPTTKTDQDEKCSSLSLESVDQDLLNGKYGKAAQVAMQILIRMAKLQSAEKLIDITQAQIDGCVYNGPSSLTFARKLVDWGAQVRVPTTLNAISVDQRRWRQQGIDPLFGEPASQLGDAYMQMGAVLSFTCAPYLLDTAPVSGEQIVWAESNAVLYANSVIGARTQKYADFIDICIALTGRAPFSGSHKDAGRLPNVSIKVSPPKQLNDAYWPLLGYHVGLIAGSKLPILYGLEEMGPSSDELKAFSAAFATTSSASMFHIAGVTPEAMIAHQHMQSHLPSCMVFHVTAEDLHGSWRELNTASCEQVDVVCFGNPHFSISECATLAQLCLGRRKHTDIKVYVTLGRAIHEAAVNAGYVAKLEGFGVEFITDTCWCMLIEPVIPSTANVLMTNSGKYAHYAPGLIGKDIYFDSLANCVEASCTGQHVCETPRWL